MLVQILLVVIGVLVYLWYQQRKRKIGLFKTLGIPGPEPNVLFGNLFELCTKGPIECQKQWIKKYGKTLGYYYGMRPILLSTDLDLLRNVQIKDFQKFTDRTGIFSETGQSINAADRRSLNLVNLKGAKWKQIRSLVTPTFTTSKMKTMSPVMNDCIDILLENIEEKRLSGKPFEIYALYQRLTMDVIAKTAFGIQTNVQKNPNDPFLKLATILFTVPFRFFFMLIGGSFTIARPLVSYLRVALGAAENKGSNPIEEIMDRCEAIIKARMKDSSVKQKDLIQLMIDAEVKLDYKVNDEALVAGEGAEKQNISDAGVGDATNGKKSMRLTIDQMVGNSFLFLLAGFETTSTALAFTTMMLVNYPDVQEKIRKEVSDLLEKEGKLDYGSVNQLEYLDQVFNEVLRLYPPVYLFVNREATEDAVYDSIRIPKGTIVQVPVYNLHHDPDYWPDPETFRPERFAPENRKTFNPLSWQPFGAGPRNCVGMRFAQMEAKMAIGKVVHKYKLLPTEKTDKHPLDLKVSPAIIRPKYGVPIRVELA